MTQAPMIPSVVTEKVMIPIFAITRPMGMLHSGVEKRIADPLVAPQ